MADTYSAIYFHLCSWNILLNLSKFSSNLNVLHTLATISEGSQIELFYTPLENTQCTMHHLSLSLTFYSKVSLPQYALWCHSHSNSQSNLHILIILSMLISTTETTINTMRKRIIWKTQIQCIGIWQTVPSPRWTSILCSNIRTLLYSKTKGLLGICHAREMGIHTLDVLKSLKPVAIGCCWGLAPSPQSKLHSTILDKNVLEFCFNLCFQLLPGIAARSILHIKTTRLDIVSHLMVLCFLLKLIWWYCS